MRKATIICVISTFPFVRPPWATRLLLDGFSWNLIFGYFSEICKNEFLLISDKNKGTDIHSCSYFTQFFSKWEMFQTKVEEIKTHILCTVTLFSKIVPFMRYYEKNTVSPYQPQMTIWRMRNARWIPKTTCTHPEYVILIALSRQQWLDGRVLMLLYMHIACLVVRYINCKFFGCFISTDLSCNEIPCKEILFLFAIAWDAMLFISFATNLCGGSKRVWECKIATLRSSTCFFSVSCNPHAVCNYTLLTVQGLLYCLVCDSVTSSYARVSA